MSILAAFEVSRHHAALAAFALRPDYRGYDAARARAAMMLASRGCFASGGTNMADISPDLCMDAVLAYQQTAAIRAALELDLFSEIGKGNATGEAYTAREFEDMGRAGVMSQKRVRKDKELGAIEQGHLSGSGGRRK
jgi:hypothetical protein